MPQGTKAKTWFYGIGGRQFGPVTLGTLKSLAASGQLGPVALVWCSGMSGWVQAGTIRALFPNQPQADGGLGFVIPTGAHSSISVVAGYLGIFSLVFGPFTGIPAVICGALGLRDVRLHPEKKGQARAITGLVMGGTFTLIGMAIILSIAGK